ncbi:hypothetical protein [Bacillus sp. V33-4]|nr:hypothetical protein [Bacillus sp. V33-4]
MDEKLRYAAQIPTFELLFRKIMIGLGELRVDLEIYERILRFTSGTRDL